MKEFTDKEIHVESLEHLGLVASTIHDLGIIEKIDDRIPISKEKGAKTTHGQRVAAMIINGLGFIDTRLYMFAEFFENKPLERLIGKGVKAEHLNDAALGRTLDTLYEYGVTKLFSEIAFEIATEKNLLGNTVRVDSSSLMVHGEYKNEHQNDDADDQPVNVTYGFSKDHRQDLKQVMIILATTGESSFIPWMEPHSGNSSDKKIIYNAMNRMKEHFKKIKDAPPLMFIADSAAYEKCAKNGDSFLWLSRVPASIKKTKKLLALPNNDINWVDLEDGYRIYSTTVKHHSKQRWVLVYSEEAYNREIKTLERNIKKEFVELEKKVWHFEKRIFKCEKDAEIELQKFLKNFKFHTLKYTITPAMQYTKKGRPGQGAKQQTVGFYVTGKLQHDTTKIELVQRQKGRFVIATNQLDKKIFSDKNILPRYKELSSVESGFKFVKNKTFQVSSIFLKKASRIEALMMVMTLCLIVFNLAQYFLRKALKDSNETVPDQKRKPTQSPTITRVFKLFSGVQLLTINLENHTQELVANLNDILKKIVRFFGKTAMIIYGLVEKKETHQEFDPAGVFSAITL
jgi:transposase